MEQTPDGIRLIASCAALTVTLIMAVFIARDANRRGMNGLLWGLGVFLICIVFLPLYLIVRKPILHAPPAGPVEPGYTLSPQATPGFCHHCGAALLPDARFCGACGAERT